MTSLHDFAATSIDGHRIELSSYEGEVVLVVNTASQCGLTPQYAGLQQLHEEYGDRGLTILGFPCDQFLHQEPGTEEEIAEFCQRNYGVSFPMFAKIEVNGEDAHPLYAWLTGTHDGIEGGPIEWNFGKFLVGRDGTVLQRYSPQVEPAQLREDLEKALAG
jgi:glutathione peroxidase